MNKYNSNYDAIRIQYSPKIASIANSLKRWTGEMLGLKKSGAVAIKKQQESTFMERVNEAGKTAEYGNLLKDFDTYYTEQASYAKGVDYFTEIVQRNVDLLSVAHQANQVLGYAEDRKSVV